MITPHSRDYAEAYLTIGYFLGHRGQSLAAGLPEAHAAEPLAAALGSTDQGRRAKLLAAQLLRLFQAIKRERL